MIKRIMLDQFYTKPEIAKSCFDFFIDVTKKEKLFNKNMFFIEPSAGEGSFFDNLPKKRRIGIDIQPKHEEIIKGDFLTWNYKPPYKKRIVVIGNPPFGKRGQLAIDFFNHSALFADTIAFILPVSFRKYRIHKALNNDFALIATFPLLRNAFYTQNEKNYKVNTEFQVWTKLPISCKNLRLINPPPITHDDFILYQYNNTPEALKMFDKKFVFAVPAQGYQDYTRRETSAGACEKNKQWMLFDADDKEVISRLWNMDFKKIAYDCGTVVPGFRKNDVIREYTNEIIRIAKKCQRKSKRFS